jgi:hypothetical protein
MVETEQKKYGIRGTLPEGDPMRSAHLLGADWEWSRWYASEAERDRVFQEMLKKHPHYRIGDHPTQVLSKVER